MLTRYRAPLLTAQKKANLHDALPKLGAFLKVFWHNLENISERGHRPTHCSAFGRACPPALR